jgi:hypothetical protein
MSTFDVSSAKTLNRENTSVLYSLINSLATKVYTDQSTSVAGVTTTTYTPLCGVNVPMALDDLAIVLGSVNFSIGDSAPTYSFNLTGGGTGQLTVTSTMRAGIFVNGSLAGYEALQCGIVNSTDGLQQSVRVHGLVRGVSGSQAVDLRIAKSNAPGTATIYVSGHIDVFVLKNGG